MHLHCTAVRRPLVLSHDEARHEVHEAAASGKLTRPCSPRQEGKGKGKKNQQKKKKKTENETGRVQDKRDKAEIGG